MSKLHLRTIQKISEMAQVPVSRVTNDVVEIGIAAVMEKYTPLIRMEEERHERAEHLRNMFSGDKKGESNPSEDVGSGVTQELPGLDQEIHTDSGGDQAVDNGAIVIPEEGTVLDFSAAAIRPGSGAETDSSAQSVIIEDHDGELGT